jgi:hypothetical protein
MLGRLTELHPPRSEDRGHMAKRIVAGVTIRRASIALGAVLGGQGVISVALAQGASNVTIEVGECVNLQSPEERLACFERQVDAVAPQSRTAPAAAQPETRSSGSAPALPPVTPESATGTLPESAGAPTPSEHLTSKQPEQTASSARPLDESPAEFVATVTALRETVPNAYLITLDNGQVWRQNRPQEYLLQPGQRVTLRATRWGHSYRLSGDSLNGFIQVERVH